MIGQTHATGGARFAFTDRWGGVSAAPYASNNLGGAVGDDPACVTENRNLTARALGLEPAHVVWMHQVHGKDVAVIDTPGGLPAGTPVDAVVTTRRGLALAVLTADCVPVLLADPVAGVAGAAHAGRPGLLAGVVLAVVDAMTALGAEPDRLVARTGPAVCGRCYEVPEDLRQHGADLIPQTWSTTRWDTPALDLVAGVHAQLAALGLENTAASPVCTLESDDHFSYRRERVTGRIASYVWLESR